MDRLKKAALLTRLVELLRAQGSWCGETHVQKATYFLQELLKVPTGFRFVLYKHGPFSFDLRDELTALRADDLIRLELQAPPYGPRLAPNPQSKHLQEVSSWTLAKYEDRLGFVAEKFGERNVSELERLATALYVTAQLGEHASSGVRAKELRALKHHISPEAAEASIREVDRVSGEADQILN
jgi:uncharacterized protein YciW